MSQRYNHYNRYNHNNYYKKQKHNQNNYQQQSNNQVEYQQQNQMEEPTQAAEQSESIEQQTKNKHVMLSIIGVAILVIGLVGITYAFFNYTRTGTANVIKTGKISFNSTQGQAINLTNMFPIDVTNGIPNDATKVGTVTINVTGDTTYAEGVEYLVTATNVSNTVNNKSLPISIDVSVASNTTNDPATTLGTVDSDYFTNRGSSANTSIYKVLASDVIENNEKLVVGYIKSGATGVDGNIVIRAYLDASKILISDTYNNGETPTDNLGTPASMGEGKTVFTTTEWNSLQTNGVSFQVKVEANQGIWVERIIGPGEIASCPGCYFMHPTSLYYASGINNSGTTLVADITDTYSADYRTIINEAEDFNFIGFTTKNGRIDKAYACALVLPPEVNETSSEMTYSEMASYEGTPICLEASLDDNHGGDSTTSANVFANNKTLINQVFESYGEYDDTTGIGCWEEEDVYVCQGFVRATAISSGRVGMDTTNSECDIWYDGRIRCW